MFWWFQREGEYRRLEILETQPGTFELRVIYPDGSVTVETFSNADNLAKRQGEIEAALSHDGWSGPHGWVV
jgi:hypothetical protein